MAYHIKMRNGIRGYSMLTHEVHPNEQDPEEGQKPQQRQRTPVALQKSSNETQGQNYGMGSNMPSAQNDPAGFKKWCQENKACFNCDLQGQLGDALQEASIPYEYPTTENDEQQDNIKAASSECLGSFNSIGSSMMVFKGVYGYGNQRTIWWGSDHANPAKPVLRFLQHDVILGLTWFRSANPTINWARSEVTVKDRKGTHRLQLERPARTIEDAGLNLITSRHVKKARKDYGQLQLSHYGCMAVFGS
ncbi:hypothetical protein VE03_10324, partial [Pseudogymnoascus sp. 23342-1-I1]